MFIKKRYSFIDMLLWTRWEIILFIAYITLIAGLYSLAGFTFLHVPWTPIALIGTAVAFTMGLQNNSSYDRIWEARKIWGGIVNTSRTWGMMVRDMVSPKSEQSDEIRVLYYRHFAWLTTLRYAMREPKSWEHAQDHITNREWNASIYIPEKVESLEATLKPYLSEEDFEHVMSKGNKSSALLFLQSAHIKKLSNSGQLWEFSFLELEKMLQEMFTLQGKSERIKNFPYPRQFASLSYHFVWIFIVMLPLGIVPEFARLGTDLSSSYPVLSQYFIWLSVPFCAAVSWVFNTMERIGRNGENPFEGTPNDVPISTIARGIEIDMRQQFGEGLDKIPDQIFQCHNVQM